MYLHLGQDTLIKIKDIIGIFDLDKATVSKRSRNYLTAKEKEGKVYNVATDLPKSFIVCQRDGEEVVYISQLSPQTLMKRCKFIQKISYI